MASHDATPTEGSRDGSIVVLTGSGISRESGLATFRDPDGIWAQVSVDEVATPEAYARDPARVLDFYNTRRRQLTASDIVPNAAHDALVRLERQWPGEVLVVTQNVDDLHERAGQKNLIHMHGELLKVRCTACGTVHAWRADVTRETACPGCEAAGGLRPHIVWFGEMPHDMDRIFDALAACRLFLSIGTSGNVYPAAGFVAQARDTPGAHTVELNLEPSVGATQFHEQIYGPATEHVPAYVDRLLKNGL